MESENERYPPMNAKLIRPLTTEVRIVSEKDGTVEYVASDETLDSYREVIRASGWRFDQFQKNAPFVDSHNYYSIDRLLGKVVDFRVEKKQLVERVQWAKDQPGTLAEWGWKMVVGGFLKAVSVGFWPVRAVSKWDADPVAFLQQMQELGLREESGVRTIYLEQQQVELSACIIGANPNALARAYKAGCLSDEDLENFSAKVAQQRSSNNASEAHGPASAPEATKRAARLAILTEIQAHL